MVTKPKVQSNASANTTQDKVIPPVAPTATATAPAPTPASVVTPGNTNTDNLGSGIATGNAYEEAVNGLVEMGFERSLVTRAMRAAFNNPDRAAEYLMSGIPEGILQDNAGDQPAAVAQGDQPVQETGGNVPFNMFDAAANQARNTTGNTLGAQNTQGQSAAAQLSMLRNSPQFQQLRQLVQAQPELLQPLLQQLGQSSPEMMQLLSSNQEEFLSLLGEGGESGEFEDEDGGAAGAAGGQFITISPEDDAAINRVIKCVLNVAGCIRIRQKCGCRSFFGMR
jgi:UV excision repair protein RAD23